MNATKSILFSWSGDLGLCLSFQVSSKVLTTIGKSRLTQRPKLLFKILSGIDGKTVLQIKFWRSSSCVSFRGGPFFPISEGALKMSSPKKLYRASLTAKVPTLATEQSSGWSWTTWAADLLRIFLLWATSPTCPECEGSSVLVSWGGNPPPTCLETKVRQRWSIEGGLHHWLVQNMKVH